MVSLIGLEKYILLSYKNTIYYIIIKYPRKIVQVIILQYTCIYIGKQMVHMPSLEIWEWGLKIFCGIPTLTTHVDHLLYVHVVLYVSAVQSSCVFSYVRCTISNCT